ncbi:MAG: DUF3783 domain-containing protein [Lachnospiraceae bacterium]
MAKNNANAEDIKSRLQQVVLLYNLPEDKKNYIIGLLLKLNINSAQVQREIYNFPLEVILGKKNAEGLKAYEGAELREPMMIMHGLTPDQVDLVLKNFRANNINIGLKAVTTPTNLKWTSLQMYMMLQRERAQIVKMNQNKNPQK